MNARLLGLGLLGHDRRTAAIQTRERVRLPQAALVQDSKAESIVKAESHTRLGWKTMCATDPDLQCFLEARALLREWLVTKEELLWRIRHILPERDGFRKATERLLYNSGVSHFQSCADDCAERFGATQADGRFPHFDSFIDVFYGDAQEVQTRVLQWSRRLFEVRSRSPPRKKRRGDPKRKPARPTLLDRSLLRDVGERARAFMRAVRALPHFNHAWESKMVAAGVALVVADGDLRAKEAVFLKNLAKAERVLEESPLCAQDVLDIVLILRQLLPASDVAKRVPSFVCKCPSGGGM